MLKRPDRWEQGPRAAWTQGTGGEPALSKSFCKLALKLQGDREPMGVVKGITKEHSENPGTAAASVTCPWWAR